ncbi:MAG: rRNA maturation RNase YbeY [Clostridia bacterium]|nr:rRNA maturation RNase YbeY [Clostridia bacterium]
MSTLKVICEEKEGELFDIQKVADCAYQTLGQTEELLIEIAFVSEEEIKELNNEQRNIDKVTDVLSFPYLDEIRGKILTPEHFGNEREDEGFLLGSICICMQRAKEQAEEYGHSLEREICYLALHGILHCFGYDHIEKADEEEMTKLAEQIMTTLNLKRN